jgi:hypothetical protein
MSFFNSQALREPGVDYLKMGSTPHRDHRAFGIINVRRKRPFPFCTTQNQGAKKYCNQSHSVRYIIEARPAEK